MQDYLPDSKESKDEYDSKDTFKYIYDDKKDNNDSKSVRRTSSTSSILLFKKPSSSSSSSLSDFKKKFFPSEEFLRDMTEIDTNTIDDYFNDNDDGIFIDINDTNISSSSSSPSPSLSSSNKKKNLSNFSAFAKIIGESSNLKDEALQYFFPKDQIVYTFPSYGGAKNCVWYIDRSNNNDNTNSFERSSNTIHRYILRLLHEEMSIDYIMFIEKVLDILVSSSLLPYQVPTSLLSLSGDKIIKLSTGKYAQLQKCILGSIIYHRENSINLFAYGVAFGQMELALAEATTKISKQELLLIPKISKNKPFWEIIKNDEEPMIKDSLNDFNDYINSQVFDTIREYINNIIIQKNILLSKKEYFITNFIGKLLEQLIHFDLHTGNVLTLEHEDDIITGVIDFDKMHFDWRVVDVAHAISSLYINLENGHNDKLLLIKTFLNGIGKVIKYTKNEIISLPDIIKLVIVKLFESAVCHSKIKPNILEYSIQRIKNFSILMTFLDDNMNYFLSDICEGLHEN